MKWYPPNRTHPIRLEPKPWTGRERRKRLPEWTGTVVAKSPNGIKAVDKGAWLNFTKEEWRGTPFDDCKAGDRVRIEYAEDKGQTYISVIENLSLPVSGGPQRPAAPKPPAPETLMPPDQPFPPEEDPSLTIPHEGYPGFPGGEDPTEMPQAPPGSPPGGGESDTDRQSSIVRQTCIKAAGMALQHNMGNAEEKAGQMTYLAGVLEDWCWR